MRTKSQLSWAPRPLLTQSLNLLPTLVSKGIGWWLSGKGAARVDVSFGCPLRQPGATLCWPTTCLLPRQGLEELLPQVPLGQALEELLPQSLLLREALEEQLMLQALFRQAELLLWEPLGRASEELLPQVLLGQALEELLPQALLLRGALEELLLLQTLLR